MHRNPFFTMPLNTVIFDMDGTLIHFTLDTNKARTRIIEYLENNGYPKGELTVNHAISEMAKRAEQFYKENCKENGESNTKSQEILSNINKIVISVEEENIPKTTMVEGMIQVLEFLKQKNIKMAVCTYNTTNVATRCLETVKVIKKDVPDTKTANEPVQTGYISAENVYGRDLAQKKTKPDPFHYQLALTDLEEKGEDTLVIGDHPNDIMCANSIGAKSIAIIREGYEPGMFETGHFIFQHEIPAKMIPLIEAIMNDSN